MKKNLFIGSSFIIAVIMNIKIPICRCLMAISLVPFLLYTANLFGQEPSPGKIASTAKRIEAIYPKIPDNENAALIYEQAFKMMKNDNELGLDYRKILCLFAELEPDGSISPEVIAETLKFLEGNQEAIQKLREGLKIPRARYPIDLTEGNPSFIDLTTHLCSVRQMMRIFSMEALILESKSDTTAVVSSILDSIKFQSSLNDEPFTVSYLVQVACQWMLCRNVQDLLCKAQLKEKELLSLATAIPAINNYQIVKKCFLADLKIPVEEDLLYEQTLTIRAPLRSEVASTDTEQEVRKKHIEITKGQKEIILKDIDKLISIAEKKIPEAVQLSLELSREIESLNEPIKDIISSYPSVIIKAAQITANINILTTALAIERYRLKNGKLPKELNELVPLYLEAVPKDPFDSKSVKYKILDKGYCLYSIGKDLTDNGGVLGGYTPNTDIVVIITR